MEKGGRLSGRGGRSIGLRGRSRDRAKLTKKEFSLNRMIGTLHKARYTKICLAVVGLFIVNAKLWAGPLHDAVEVGAAMRIEQLILQGEDINEIDERGIWPLLVAVTYGDNRSVELLLKLGADPNLADQYNYTAMHEAAILGYRVVAKTLIKAKANLNIRDISSFTPLGYAKRSGSQEVIELLEAHGAKL